MVMGNHGSPTSTLVDVVFLLRNTCGALEKGVGVVEEAIFAVSCESGTYLWSMDYPGLCVGSWEI